MYNRYLPAAARAPEPPPKSPNRGNGSGLDGLVQFLNAHLRTGRPDADTLIVLMVIWFLLSDGALVQTDLLIFVVVLLLLGL